MTSPPPDPRRYRFSRRPSSEQLCQDLGELHRRIKDDFDPTVAEVRTEFEARAPPARSSATGLADGRLHRRYLAAQRARVARIVEELRGNRGGKIVEIDILAYPARLRELDVTVLDD